MTTKKASTAISSPKANNPAAEDTQEDEVVRVEPHSDTPSWVYWRRRPTIRLHDGVALVLNIRNASRALERLKQKKDARTSPFNSELKTARDWLGVDKLLMPADGHVHKSVDARNKTKVYLAHFVEWVRHSHRLVTTPPAEFFALSSPLPDGVPTAAEILTKSAQSDDAESGKSQRRSARTPTSELTLAFLLLYLHKLANSGRPPSAEFFKDSTRKLNVSLFAEELCALADYRVDLKSSTAAKSSGASAPTLGKRLSEALDLVDLARYIDETKDAVEARPGR